MPHNNRSMKASPKIHPMVVINHERIRVTALSGHCKHNSFGSFSSALKPPSSSCLSQATKVWKPSEVNASQHSDLTRHRTTQGTLFFPLAWLLCCQSSYDISRRGVLPSPPAQGIHQGRRLLYTAAKCWLLISRLAF